MAHDVANGECKKHEAFFKDGVVSACPIEDSSSGSVPRTHSTHSANTEQESDHQSLSADARSHVPADDLKHTYVHQVTASAHYRKSATDKTHTTAQTLHEVRVVTHGGGRSAGGEAATRPSSAGHGHPQHEFEGEARSRYMPELSRVDSVDQFNYMPGSFPGT